MYVLLDRGDRSGSIILLMLYIYSVFYKLNIKYDGIFTDKHWWNNKLFLDTVFNYFGIKNIIASDIDITKLKYIPFEKLDNLSNEEKQSSDLYSIFMVGRSNNDVKDHFAISEPFLMNLEKRDKTLNYYFDENFRNYLFSKLKQNPFKFNNKILSVHIRRGDVNSNDKRRYTSDQTYLNLIESITKNNPDLDIHIFSENRFNGNVQLYKNNKTTLHLSANSGFHNFNQIFDDILFMIYSDYLIMSKSAFSYIAGLLNRNIVYFNNNFWCGSLNNFLVYDNETGNILDANWRQKVIHRIV